MDFAPARIGSERADGTMQWSEMGPASYWPEWIPEIADARLTIVSYDLASDGYPASGMGDLNPGIPFAQLQARYGSQLERDGWDAAFWYQNTTFGTLPPRDVRICTIIARRGTHSFWVALYEGEEAQIRLVWTDGGPGQSAVKDSQKGKC